MLVANCPFNINMFDYVILTLVVIMETETEQTVASRNYIRTCFGTMPHLTDNQLFYYRCLTSILNLSICCLFFDKIPLLLLIDSLGRAIMLNRRITDESIKLNVITTVIIAILMILAFSPLLDLVKTLRPPLAFDSRLVSDVSLTSICLFCVLRVVDIVLHNSDSTSSVLQKVAITTCDLVVSIAILFDFLFFRYFTGHFIGANILDITFAVCSLIVFEAWIFCYFAHFLRMLLV